MEITIRNTEEILTSTMEQIIAQSKSKNVLTGIPTGVKDLDSFTSGLQPQELSILASRPGIGKTNMAISIGLSASKAGHGVLFLSLEMNEQKLMGRILSSLGKVDNGKLKTGFLRPKDLEYLRSAVPDIYNNKKLSLLSIHSMFLSGLRSVVSQAISTHEIKLLIIDYLTLLKPDGGSPNRWEQVAEISRCLKQLAFEFDLHILALCPLNRYSIGKIPLISELSESGSLEYDADNVFILHEPEEQDVAAETKELYLLISKQRNGPTGMIRLKTSRNMNIILGVD